MQFRGLVHAALKQLHDAAAKPLPRRVPGTNAGLATILVEHFGQDQKLI